MHETKRQVIAATHSQAGTGIDVLEITPLIAQGNAKFNRIGNRIMYKFLTLDFYTHYTQTNDTGADVYPVRVVLFTGRSIITNATDILEEGVTSVNQNTIYVPLKSEMCNVLMDKKFILTPLNDAVVNSSITNFPVAKHLKYHHRLPRNVLFDRTGTAQPLDPQDRIYVAILNGTANTTFANHIGGRLSFIDL